MLQIAAVDLPLMAEYAEQTNRDSKRLLNQNCEDIAS